MSPLVFTGIPIGLAFGYALSRGRFCMNSAFRDIIVMKDYTLIKAVGMAILVSMLGFAVMSAAGVIVTNPKPLFWGANILGSFLFGIGMVVAGGCASGITYRSGEGMVGAMSAVLGFAIFGTMTAAGALKPVASFLQTSTKVTFADGSTPTLAFGAPYHVVALIISIVGLVIWFALSRRGKAAAKKEAVPLKERILKQGWSWFPTGIVIGLISIAAFPASAASGRNYPLGITGGYIATLNSLVTGKNLMSWEAIMVLSAILGAFIAARSSGEFKLRAPAPSVLIQTFFGGALMGFGAVVSSGCNIGHILSGVPQLSLGSILGGLFIVLGCWTLSYFWFIRPMKNLG
ncbi:MAG: YeeE/YedE family protein [Dehalococcoidia bacterium]